MRLCMYYGPEFVCTAVRRWSEQRGVRLDYIAPGRPVQNGHVESLQWQASRRVSEYALVQDDATSQGHH